MMCGNTCEDGAKPGTPERRHRLTYDVNAQYLGNDDRRILLRCERAARTSKMGQIDSGSRRGVEGEFIDLVVKRITETLEINWKDHATFQSVLKAAIGDHIQDFLTDYLDFWVEEYNNKMVRDFDLSEDVQPGYTHAQHAKLSPAIEAVKEKFQELQKQIGELTRMGVIGAKDDKKE